MATTNEPQPTEDRAIILDVQAEGKNTENSPQGGLTGLQRSYTGVDWSDVLGKVPLSKEEYIKKARETGRLPEVSKKEVSSGTLERAKSIIVRIATDPELIENTDFSFLKEAIEALYVDKQGNRTLQLNQLDLGTPEGQRQLNEAINRLLEAHPDKTVALGLIAFQRLATKINSAFDLKEIKSPEKQKQEDLSKKLPKFGDILRNIGLEEYIKIERTGDGDFDMSLVIPEDLTYERYQEIYQQKLEELKKQIQPRPIKFLFINIDGSLRAKKELEAKGLRMFTEEEFNQIKGTYSEEKAASFKIILKPETTGQNDKNGVLSRFLQIGQLDEFNNLPPQQKMDVIRILFGVIDDYKAVFNEVRKVTGAPPIEGGINKLIEIGLLVGLNEKEMISQVIEKISQHSKAEIQRASQARREKLIEDDILAIKDRKKNLEEQLNKIESTKENSQGQNEQSSKENIILKELEQAGFTQDELVRLETGQFVITRVLTQ